jgi:hypothetical protein
MGKEGKASGPCPQEYARQQVRDFMQGDAGQIPERQDQNSRGTGPALNGDKQNDQADAADMPECMVCHETSLQIRGCTDLTEWLLYHIVDGSVPSFSLLVPSAPDCI